ncbi:MAG: hypothetical protein H0V89_07115 [Deltaproteobacteria bacterium]|nr:hypothetical protein [Deltaproteobacteria bacterium]
MIRTMMLGALVLTGCGSTEPPLFEGITQVVILPVGSGGLKRTEVVGGDLSKVTSCLMRGTNEISAEKASEELLAVVYLVEINDKRGARAFELYTDKNLKGNRGKYYENKCIYELISNLGR